MKTTDSWLYFKGRFEHFVVALKKQCFVCILLCKATKFDFRQYSAEYSGENVT